MIWVGISGSWRLTNEQVEKDVRNTVRTLVTAGKGIVTGGALNVDYFATDEVMKIDPTLVHLKIFLPVKLDRYATHYFKRAEEGVITKDQAEILIHQLREVKRINSNVLIENPKNTIVNRQTYFLRNGEVIKHSDELYAFQVNNSIGVEDTIEKATEKGIPVKLFQYTITQ